MVFFVELSNAPSWCFVFSRSPGMRHTICYQRSKITYQINICTIFLAFYVKTQLSITNVMLQKWCLINLVLEFVTDTFFIYCTRGLIFIETLCKLKSFVQHLHSYLVGGKLITVFCDNVADTWVSFIYFYRMKSRCSPQGWIPRWYSSSTQPRVERVTGKCGSEPKSGTNTLTTCEHWLLPPLMLCQGVKIYILNFKVLVP